MKNLSKSLMFLLLIVSLLSFNKSEAFYIGAGPVGFGFDVGSPYYYDDYYYNGYYDGPYYSRPYGYGYYGHRHHPRYHRVSGRYY